jgi:hypothetical protein
MSLSLTVSDSKPNLIFYDKLLKKDKILKKYQANLFIASNSAIKLLNVKWCILKIVQLWKLGYITVRPVD